jgi:hypothetical protein
MGVCSSGVKFTIIYAKREKEKEAQNGDPQAEEKTSQEQTQEEIVEVVAILLCFLLYTSFYFNHQMF